MLKIITATLIMAACSGCVRIYADSNGRILYSGEVMGVYCSGVVSENHYNDCTFDSRKVIKKDE